MSTSSGTGDEKGRANTPAREGWRAHKDTVVGKLTTAQEKVSNGIDAFNFRVCRSMAKRPLTHFLSYWGIMFLILIIILAGGYLQLAQVALIDFMIPTVNDVQLDFALKAGLDEVKARSGITTEVLHRQQRVGTFSFFFMYESTDGESVITPENIQKICEIENLVLEDENYRFFCQTENENLGDNTACLPPGVTITFNFYRNVRDCRLLSQTDVDTAYDVIVNSNITRIRGLVNDPINPTLAKSSIILGGPLGRDSPPFIDFNETEDIFLEPQAADGYSVIMESFKNAVLDYMGVADTPFNQGFKRKTFGVDGTTMTARVHGPHLEFLEFQYVVQIDSLISGGSFAVVTLLVFMYTRSCFFSVLTMIAVAMSVFMGLFLYAIVFQIDYFNNLHVVVLFIILAIGANNIFVLVDAWRQSEAVILEEIEIEKLRGERKDLEELKSEKKEQKTQLSRVELGVNNEGILEVKEVDGDYTEVEVPFEEILRRRLTYAYSRAALSVANTALTTFLAFVATAVSDLAPIAAFGLFAGLVILVNLIYMLNVHPSTLIVYYVYIQIPWQKRKERLKAEKQGGVVEVELNPEPSKPTKRKWINRRFDDYIYLINHTHFAKFALFGTVVFGITMTAFAFQLETPTSVEGNFNDDHMFTGFQDKFTNDFASSNNEDILSQARAVFGIKALDNSGVPRFSTDSFRGAPVYDPDFEIHTERAQNFISDFCDEIRIRDCQDLDGCTEDTLYSPTTLDCWMQDFRIWHTNNLIEDEIFTLSVDGRRTGTSVTRFNEMLIEFLGEQDSLEKQYNLDIGFVEKEIKFVTLRYLKSMEEDQPLTVKQPVIRLMEEMSQEFRDRAADEGLVGMESLYQTSFDVVWQHTEEALVSGLYSGMAISLTASFAVVLSGTRNLIVSIYAIAGVGAIVMCVLGTTYTFGWELGTAEALAGVMVIGLAVDYTVHLGHMFVHSKKYLAEHDISDLAKENDKDHKSRIVQTLIEIENEKEGEEEKDNDKVKDKVDEEKKERSFEPRTEFYNADMVHYAVDRMGVTILAGAFTTFCSGIFLLLCTLAFFTKMAILIVLTVIYSTMFAFLFFVPMLRLFGPGIKNKAKHMAEKQGNANKITV